jgi:hypothetical protein
LKKIFVIALSLMDNFLWITRKDLSLLWGVSRRDNTYMEDKLPPAG